MLIVFGVIVGYSLLYGSAVMALHKNGHDAAYFIGVRADEGGDSYQYVVLAQTILSDGRFAMSPTAPPEYFRTPGYPLFIAAILATTHTIAVLPVAQIILVALICWLIYILGERFFSRGIGLSAALLFAIDPATVNIAFISASDILFIFLFLASLVVLTVTDRKASHLLLGGLLLGAATLTRPLGLYLIPIVFIWLLWETRMIWRVMLKTAGFFLCGVLIVLTPWVARNYILFHQLKISSIGSYNLLFYAQEFEHQRTSAPKAAVKAEVYERLGATPSADISSAEYVTKDTQVALGYILAHPFAYTAFHLYSMIPFYFGSSLDMFEGTLYMRGILPGAPPFDVNVSVLLRTGDIHGAIAALAANIPSLIERVAWLIFGVAAFTILVVAFRRRHPHRTIYALFFVFILAFGLMTGPVAYARYRLPVSPFIFLLGCAGMIHGARILTPKRVAEVDKYQQ